MSALCCAPTRPSALNSNLMIGEVILSDQDYSEIVKQAEKAVASIKDGDLKTIAFGKILDTLLGEGGGTNEKHRRTKSKRSPGDKSARADQAKSGRKKTGPKSYVEELIEEDFFKVPQTLAAVRAELGNRGHHVPLNLLSKPMMLLCQERKLRRQKSKDGNKQVFTYSNW